jgi:hypothetical protein
MERHLSKKKLRKSSKIGRQRFLKVERRKRKGFEIDKKMLYEFFNKLFPK